MVEESSAGQAIEGVTHVRWHKLYACLYCPLLTRPAQGISAALDMLRPFLPAASAINVTSFNFGKTAHSRQL